MEEVFIVYNQRALSYEEFEDTKLFKKKDNARDYCKRLCIDKYIRSHVVLKQWNWFGIDVNCYSTQLTLNQIFGQDKVTTRVLRNINGTAIETFASLVSIDTDGANDETLLKFLSLCKRFGQYHVERLILE